MDTFSNGLTEAQAEALALLAEEAAEVVQAVTKILRHGTTSKHPRDLDGDDNGEHLETEIGDFLAAKEIVEAQGLVRALRIEIARTRKLSRVGRYLHHATVNAVKPNRLEVATDLLRSAYAAMETSRVDPGYYPSDTHAAIREFFEVTP